MQAYVNSGLAGSRFHLHGPRHGFLLTLKKSMNIVRDIYVTSGQFNSNCIY